MPALLAHRITDLEYIQLQSVRDRKRDNRRGRVAEHAQLRDLGAYAVRDRLGRADNALARLQIAVMAHVLQGRPRSGDERPGAVGHISMAAGAEKKRGAHTESRRYWGWRRHRPPSRG